MGQAVARRSGGARWGDAHGDGPRQHVCILTGRGLQAHPPCVYTWHDRGLARTRRHQNAAIKLGTGRAMRHVHAQPYAGIRIPCVTSLHHAAGAVCPRPPRSCSLSFAVVNPPCPRPPPRARSARLHTCASLALVTPPPRHPPQPHPTPPTLPPQGLACTAHPTAQTQHATGRAGWPSWPASPFWAARQQRPRPCPCPAQPWALPARALTGGRGQPTAAVVRAESRQ